MFRNHQWELPENLVPVKTPREELTLWRACELFMKYPGVSDCKSRWRYEIALANLVDKLGKERLIKSLWVPDLRAYQVQRQSEGAAADTVNKEMGVLSRLFGVLVEMQAVETNPVRLLKRLPVKSSQRHVYISRQDVERIAGECPPWFQRIIWTAYYTGMRRGEILAMTRKGLNLAKRIIALSPEDTKEGHWKRVPIHQELVPILEDALKVSCLRTDRVFLVQDEKGVREPGTDSIKNCWPRACRRLKMEEPWLRFHDLRHTWRANARRSGMDRDIAESILGHWLRGRSVNERYGAISDQELIRAVDAMEFDHGETEIRVPDWKGASVKNGNKMVTMTGSKKKGHVAS